MTGGRTFTFGYTNDYIVFIYCKKYEEHDWVRQLDMLLKSNQRNTVVKCKRLGKE